MDLARFDQFFAADVTMFFPDRLFLGARDEGREAVLTGGKRNDGFRVRTGGKPSLVHAERTLAVITILLLGTPPGKFRPLKLMLR